MGHIKVRKLATAAAVSLVLASGGVRALGLGDIEMRSALNQPMNAEIRLTSVQPGEASGMIVKLASADAFSRAGIERTAALTDLRFAVEEVGGTPVIRISSSRPVVEPFLNFLLEVDWPTGRMVREYTVLLDPPVFMTPSASERNTASEQPATLQRSDTSLITPTPIERSNATDNFEVEIVGSSVEIADNAAFPSDAGEVVSLDDLGGSDIGSVELIDDSVAPISEQGDVVSLTDLGTGNAGTQFQPTPNFEFDVEIVGTSSEVSDTFVGGSDVVDSSEVVSLDALEADVVTSDVAEVTVQRGDTLSSIADGVEVPGISSQQMMMALLSANKNAFINGNINLVKAGAILRIPDSNELAQLTQAQAIAQIGEQDQLWREYRDNIRSSAGTRVAAAPTPTPEPEPEVEVNTELSDAAQRILDAARDEATNRKELNIVAQSDSTTTAASATADNSEASDAAQLGEINKKLQLAKEELASTRLESIDLTEQSDELQSTTENMESLVNIRQNEVARLEEALLVASAEQAAAEQAAAEQAAAAERAAAEQAAAEQAATEQAAAEQLAAEQLAAEQAATDTDATGTDATGTATDEVVADAETAIVDTIPESNALTEAGETLAEVELVDDAATTPETVEPGAETQSAAPWYMQLLQKYGKWVVIGIAGISALLFGGLLLGKRRRKDADEMLDYGDEVEFIDDIDDGVQINADVDTSIDTNIDANTDTGIDTRIDADTGPSGIDSAVAAAGAAGVGAAAVGGAAAAFGSESDVEQSESLGAQMDAMDSTSGPDGLDPDDTISEVDVYLAYGLHGQAEELLSKAIDRDPANHEYALKLLQTQHAQGNADAFAQGAENYHESFGGIKAPNWDTVCNLGHDLQPNNELFASSATAVESIGKGNHGVDMLETDDFATDEDSGVGSVSRDFGNASETPLDVDETDLMDQSLDPAFAFDETDLEATGDFSQITNGVANEELLVNPDTDTLLDDTSLDFPGFDAAESLDDLADAGKDSLSGAGASLGAGIGGMAAGGAAAVGGMAASAKDSAAGAFDDALSLDDLDSAASAANDGAQGSVAEDLTLDLDQLSGDLELDGTDLLDQTSVTALDDLDIPDLTGDNELLTDNVANIDGSDEMDTMMDLAKAYIDMGDKDSASSALGEIVKSGNPAQVSEAETLLRKIS